MVGVYSFIKDLMLSMRSIGLIGRVLSFLRSVLPGQSVKWIFSTNLTGLTNPVFGTGMTQRFGFQGKFENKFSSYEGKDILKSWKPGVFENEFTHSKCSYSTGNCLFLLPLLLLTVRGLYLTLFQMYWKQRILSFVYVWCGR